MPLPRKIGLSKCTRTLPAAMRIMERLQSAGVEVVSIDDSPSAVAAIRAGQLEAIIEVSLADFAIALERLSAACQDGVPLVVVPGGLDGIRSIPEARTRGTAIRIEGREYIRSSPAVNDGFGRQIAFLASASSGPVTILLPRGGLSVLDRPGEPFWDPAADAALFQSLRNWISSDVTVLDVESHIDDEACTDAVIAALEAIVAR